MLPSPLWSQGESNIKFAYSERKATDLVFPKGLYFSGSSFYVKENTGATSWWKRRAFRWPSVPAGCWEFGAASDWLSLEPQSGEAELLSRRCEDPQDKEAELPLSKAMTKCGVSNCPLPSLYLCSHLQVDDLSGIYIYVTSCIHSLFIHSVVIILTL